MDPNLFHLDWERTLEAFAAIIVLSFLVERACALLFESCWWIGRFEDERIGKPPGGLDFLANLSEGVQEDIESVTPTRPW